MASDLDRLLEALGNEGQVESLGRFSLSAEKLREKLAAFQFERPSQWVLKLVQALVLAKATNCDVLQSRNRTKFALQSDQCLFPIEEVEQAFFNPELEMAPGLKYLLTCLWYLSFNLKVAWIWQDGRSNSGLMWTGNQLERVELSGASVALLEISHQKRSSQGGWWSDLISAASLQGPEGCANVARELTTYAYTCPFPLKLDGRRIDSLAYCSTLAQPLLLDGRDIIRSHETVCVAAIGWGRAIGPLVQWPEGTQAKHFKNRFLKSPQIADHPQAAAWIALLAVHMKAVSVNRSNYWAPIFVGSRVSWVQHGVMISEDPLAAVAGVSCHLFVSANERSTDLSGFRLIDKPDLSREIADTLRPWLTQQSIEFSIRRSNYQQIGSLMLGTMAIGGVCVFGTDLTLMIGLKSLGFGAIAKGFAHVIDDSRDLESRFREQHKMMLEELSKSWQLGTNPSR